MTTAAKIVASLFVLIASALAQHAMSGAAPAAAGYGPAYDVSVGYTYLAMSVPTGASANLNGLDGNGVVDFSRHWGATVDATYVSASNVLNLGHGSYVLTFLIGPVFYPIQGRNTRLSMRLLGGAGLVDSAVPTSGNMTLRGWVARPSYAAGMGVEHSILGPFAVRLNGDYLRTAFVDSTAVVRPQNNLRMTFSLVLHLRERQ